jgi:hypothetical protein
MLCGMGDTFLFFGLWLVVGGGKLSDLPTDIFFFC